LRRLFAFLRDNECYGDFSPTDSRRDGRLSPVSQPEVALASLFLDSSFVAFDGK
jgi:hypothetical protein